MYSGRNILKFQRICRFLSWWWRQLDPSLS